MTDQAKQDLKFMAQAIQLAKKGIYTTHPNPRVGCVITQNGKVIGSGFHPKAGQPHAEVFAIRAAKEALGTEDLSGCTAYVTLEPCSHQGRTPPCAKGLIEAKVTRVVAAMTDPNPKVSGRGLQMLKEAGIEVKVGVLEAEARTLNPGFISHHQHNKAFIRVKMAMSLDGRTAMENGESKWITGPMARQDVQRYRAQSSAIITGIGTLLADDPSLNLRLADWPEANTPDLKERIDHPPVRVLLDRLGRAPNESKLFNQPGKVLWFVSDQLRAVPPAPNSQVEVIVCEEKDGQINLDWVLSALLERDLHELWVEAGAKLSSAFVEQGLVDELIVYMAPALMGGTAKPLFDLNIESMSDKINLQIDDIRAVGGDWKILARPHKV